MKRFTKAMVALLLVAAMTITICPAVSAAHFEDVTNSMEEEFRDAINYVSDNGIMIGSDPEYFSPEVNITRAEFMLTLFRAAANYYVSFAADVFTDVENGTLYYYAIGWAVEKGITVGTTATTFSPNDPITREQAILFLYRLAGVLEYDRIADEVLTLAGDYSSVSTYAHDAFTWAYEYGILKRDSLTENINPRANVSRKHTALYIALFRRNIEGIVYQRDHFNFWNNEYYFISNNADRYVISESDWAYIEDALLTRWTQSGTDVFVNMPFEGLCYGMAVAEILDYQGKIDLNGNFCNDASNLYFIPFLDELTDSRHKITYDRRDPTVAITEVESILNLYFYCQFVPGMDEATERIDVQTGLEEILEKLEHSGMGLFSYCASEDGKGHAVVAYGKPIKTTYGYKIKLHDNRFNWTVTWLEIYDIGGELRGFITGNIDGVDLIEQVFECKFQDDFSSLTFDIDGDENILTTQANENCNEMVLAVQATGDFTITNAEGETLTHSLSAADTVTGNMNVLGTDFITLGTDSPCMYLFTVEASDDFTCVAEDGEEILVFVTSVNNSDSSGDVSVMAAEEAEQTEEE